MTDKSQHNGNGDSIANGNTLPAWLRYDPLWREIYESRYCFWTVMA